MVIAAKIRNRMVCQRGSSSLELVIIVPVVLLIVMGILQAGLWYFAKETALAAAQEGARAAAAQRGSAGEGEAAANRLVARSGSSLIGAQASASRTPTTSTVTVSGRCTSLVPGLPIDVSQTVSVPVERITQ